MTMLSVPPVAAGGPQEPERCHYGAGSCGGLGEIEVSVPATRAVRVLCRGCVGPYMLAVTAEFFATVMRVRQLSTSAISERTRTRSD